MSLPRLNIIGCGNVGTSLATLWQQSTFCSIGEILTTHLHSATTAVSHIHAGTAIDSYAHFSPAELWMIATPDSQIATVAQQLTESQIIRSSDTVFHCSGALSSHTLSSLTEQTAHLASLHPVLSFPSPVTQCELFKGTYCGIEGTKQATDLLKQATLSIGGSPFTIDSQQKSLYHAASVIGCNYLTALTEVSTQLLQHAGIENHTASHILQPLMKQTLTNIFTQGTTHALTGPIQRGETSVIEKQLASLTEHSPDIAELYKNLGRVALSLTDHPASTHQTLRDLLQ